jgi:type IV pilus assembly protein PilM
MHSFLDKYFSLIKRRISSPSEGSSVGLDIGAGDCKFVQIQKNGDSFTLLNWGIEPLVREDVEAALKKVLERLKPPYKSICTSVFGKGTLIRYIEMPRMSLDDLKKSFAIEADKYFPFPQDQIYTDCFILDPQGKDRQMSVMAAAAKKEMIDGRLKLLNKLGIQTDFIGINPVVLANGLYVLGTREEQCPVVAIFDMGESVSNLTILDDQLPRFTRDIFIGGRDLTKRISNALGLSFQEAENLKKQPAQRSEDVLSACESAIISLVQELRLSFDYFMTEKNREINKLLLTGGASMLEGVSEIFKRTLDVQIGVWDPVAPLKIPPELSVEEMGKKSLRLGVAVGLALYSYD